MAQEEYREVFNRKFNGLLLIAVKWEVVFSLNLAIFPPKNNNKNNIYFVLFFPSYQAEEIMTNDLSLGTGMSKTNLNTNCDTGQKCSKKNAGISTASFPSPTLQGLYL